MYGEKVARWERLDVAFVVHIQLRARGQSAPIIGCKGVRSCSSAVFFEQERRLVVPAQMVNDAVKSISRILSPRLPIHGRSNIWLAETADAF